MVSLTRRFVRTSMRRTLSSSSAIVIMASRNPNTESRNPKEIRIPKSEIRRSGRRWMARTVCQIRPSDFGLLSAFGFRVSDLSSRHRHGVEYLLDDGVGRHRLRLGFIGQDEPVPQHVGADALNVFRGY